MKIAIGCDHGGYILKTKIIKNLKTEIEFIDCGTFDESSCDYPDYAIATALKVAIGECDYGVVICKSGIGVSIAANKVKGIRCALVSDENTAILSRQHNNANMLAFGVNHVNLETAINCIKSFVSTEFLKGRHEIRVDKISQFELNQK